MKLTPAMQQFMKIKNENPDCLLFFRMGDFYETFFDDAKTVSKELNMVLTARGKDKIPLAGMPFHSVEPYIAKLIKKGYKVGIVEQLEDPKKAKGIVKRGLVRIVTPGTVLDDNVLDENSNNYLVSISKDKKFGVSSIDLSTGEFMVTEVDEFDDLYNELKTLNPSEIIVPSVVEKSDWVKQIKDSSFVVNGYNDVYFFYENSESNLLKHFKTLSLKGFDIEGKISAISSAGAIISYLKETQMTELSNITTIRYYQNRNYMVLDNVTTKNLEIFNNIYNNTQNNTLFSVVDFTKTPMGSRLLRQWIQKPLLDKNQILERLDAVEELIKNHPELIEIQEFLKKSLDVQRLLSKITNGMNCPKDMIGLKNSLGLIPDVKKHLKGMKSDLIGKLFSKEDESQEIFQLIDNSIMDEPLSHLREGNVIKSQYSKELDEIKSISQNAKQFILQLEEQERENTGIKSLKIKYNRVFGYFIEVTKSNLHLVPDNYVRKQTQVNCERFITDDLKKKEELILNAQEKQIQLEQKLYAVIVEKITAQADVILDVAYDLSVVDVVGSFAHMAINHDYVKPKIKTSYDIQITKGRHAVIERFEEQYIPNDCRFDKKNNMMIITGPNMSGKSSVMRQTALIIILAQIGSFVPAKSAEIGIVDRIFTRIGASDDLSSGQSTFMVEMNETANIINNATENSFIILDEIGRGTSTFDGISLAWAIAEYICKQINAKTMFATHYHQLNKLAEGYSNIRNFNISVLENDDRIVFLHKLEEGGTDRSYGVEVAKLAGLPKELIDNAKKVMKELELEDKIADRLKASPKKLNKKIETNDIDKEIRQLTLNDL